jgi:hypothetical protein
MLARSLNILKRNAMTPKSVSPARIFSGRRDHISDLITHNVSLRGKTTSCHGGGQYGYRPHARMKARFKLPVWMLAVP